MARTLRQGQRAQLFIADADTGETTLLAESRDLLFEAPNWTPDGRHLIVNGDGRLFRVHVASGEFAEIDLGNVAELNNDHVLAPDGATVYVSSDDGHLYAVSLVGAHEPRRVSNDRGPSFRYYLHGISPDGAQLAYIGLEILPHGVRTNVFTIPSAGGPDMQLTDEDAPHDGSEFSPDGQWIYFNSERGSSMPGHAQLFRMSPDGEDVTQLTFDDRVNWFPHLTPGGERMAYISYPPGTLGHPADLNVIIRTASPLGEEVRDLVHLFGGQGTLNVNSWDPTGTQLAYVAYPID
ncbi:TolB family protein [Demequina sp.]|uniref:TolB family protein n=1 Tax=Demequina sp. TaxID=2050685 RepID=UPI003D102EEE